MGSGVGGAESSYVYDANGNMVSGVMNGSGFSATYNEQDRLINFKAEQSEEQQTETTQQSFVTSGDDETDGSKKKKKGKVKRFLVEKIKSFFKAPGKTVRKIACGLFNQKGKAKGKEPKFCRNMDEPDDPVNPVTPLTGMGDYFYNASGELIRIEATEGNTVYTRGELGVINSITLPDSQDISYKTDYDARRVEKLNSSTQNYRRIYQNELQLAAEINGTELSEFFYAMSINSPDLMKKAGVNYRIIKDHLGSPRLVINTVDGTIMQRMDFNEWGRVLLDTNPGFTPFGFAGGLMDQDTKLVRFGARDYNPNTARWISKDPIGFNGGDTNLYRYSFNNPMNFIDPFGTDTVGVGFSGTFSGFGFSATAGFQLVKDDKGNTGISFFGGAGAGAAVPNVAITTDFTKTNANTISDLGGPGFQAGASATIGAPVGVTGGAEATGGSGFLGGTGSIGVGTTGAGAFVIPTATKIVPFGEPAGGICGTR